MLCCRVDAAAEQHRAGVHADAHVDAGVAVPARERIGMAPALGEQRQAGVHGALRIVFAHLVRAERSEQAVAGVLQDLALMRLDDFRAAREQGVDRGVHVFRIEVLGKRGRADDVEEQHAHLAQRLLGRRRGVERCQFGAQRGERRIGKRAAEHRALVLERRDGTFDFLPLGRHGAEDNNPTTPLAALGMCRRARCGAGDSCAASSASPTIGRIISPRVGQRRRTAPAPNRQRSPQ